MTSYEDTMAYGASQYADVLDALAHQGHRAEFTQTGGMCAALMITLEAGFYLLVTDEEETLSWERAEHRGWWAGLHADPDVHPEIDSPIRDRQTSDNSIHALLALVKEVMNLRG